MAGLADALSALDAHPHCVPASAWPGSLTHLDGPGLYAWWVDAPGAKDLSTGLGLGLHPGRFHVGQAGAASSRAGIPSASTLRSRIGRNHLGGRIRSSTLRRTLAAVLLAPLALDLVGSRRLDAASEAKLSEWMRRHGAADWLRDHDEVLVALDAPLVWPRPLAAALPGHRVGEALKPSADELFSRGTDVAIWRRLHKQPLEVHSNNADRD